MDRLLLGQGRTAEIYAWQAGQVLKLYRSRCPTEWVEYEASIGRSIHALGLPGPAVIDVVEVDGRQGVVFERIDGPSMLTVFGQTPWKLPQLAYQLAELQAAIHAVRLPQLPSLRDSLERRIEGVALSDAIKTAALYVLAQLPDDNVVCHGDFHPDNIILSPRGPIVLDWMTATKGDALADVARTSLILRLGDVPPGAPHRRWLLLARDVFHRLYLSRYVQLRQVTEQAVEAWRLPVAVARTREDIPPERQRLAALIESLVAHVQSN